MNFEGFGTWLLTQKSRNDPVGDLSKYANDDRWFPETTYDKVKDYFKGRNDVYDGYMTALETAWIEYNEEFHWSFLFRTNHISNSTSYSYNNPYYNPYYNHWN